MQDETVEGTPRTYSGALLAAIAVALLLGLGGILWSYTLSHKLAAQQQALTDAAAQNTKLAAALQDTNARLNVATDTLKTSLGVTQKQLDTRSAALQVREAHEEQKIRSGSKWHFRHRSGRQAATVIRVGSSVRTVGWVERSEPHQ